MRIKRNYHTHTFHCGHSTLQIDEAVNLSANIGLETLGFSEHVYAPGAPKESVAKTKANLLAYVKEVNEAKVVYKDKIRILCGFELNITDPISGSDLHEFNQDLLKIKGVDYGILGFHNYYDGMNCYENPLNEKRVSHLLSSIEMAVIKTGVRYLAHPDGFMEGHQKWDELASRVSRGILDIAVRHDLELGINVNGVCLNRKYPSPEFWKLASRYDIKAIIELDAHSMRVFDREQIAKTTLLATENGIRIVEHAYFDWE